MDIDDEWLAWVETLDTEKFEALMIYWESDDCKDIEEELERLERDAN